jgi:NADP-reducing hydrogenase subunit HndB
MPVLGSLDDLMRLREEARQALKTRAQTGTVITVGLGTCGAAAGAGETMHAITAELERRDIHAHVVTVGCIGQCIKEPLVDIALAGQPRITYGNVKPDMVPRLIEEHLIQGQPVREWVVGMQSPANLAGQDPDVSAGM